jgi:4-diphosphocytidyl-2-C-methyl-D-erythritol kinase
VIIFPNCKINLGLTITGKRDDGYHNLETIFYPLPLFDVLEIVVSQNGFAGEISINTSGLQIAGNLEDNLCLKAYKLLKRDFPRLPSIICHIHKSIPVGAGLGGGSADAAFMLKLLNAKFELGLVDSQLSAYALQLGSDCPFFMINKPSIGTGRGENLEPVELDLSAYNFVLVNPGIHISTAEAFSLIKPKPVSYSLIEMVSRPPEQWKDNLNNDFEEGIFNSFPQIREIRDQLYLHGAVYASMSGTGSSVFGIFHKEKKPELSFSSSYFIRELSSQLQ